VSEGLFDMIPVGYRETARSALSAAFGTTPMQLRSVGGGASGALTYRVEVSGRPYLLRIETRRDAFRNPHQYDCMRGAADAGIAPPLRHVDPQAGVVVMDLLPQYSLLEYPGGQTELVRDLGRLFARLQATPRFPLLAGGFLGILAHMVGVLHGSEVFAAGLLDPHLEGFVRIRETYRWDDPALVSSHNDPNPGNILFDGERLWLIDWETAYCNDPLTDIAIVADNFASLPEQVDVLLQAWLGHAPDRGVRGRLVLMRQLTRLYYGCLIFSVLMGRGPPETDLTALSRSEFRDAVVAGRLTIGAPETLRLLGKSYLAEFLAGLSAPGFSEAMASIRQG